MELEFYQEILLTAVFSVLFAFIIGRIAATYSGDEGRSEGNAVLAEFLGEAAALDRPVDGVLFASDGSGRVQDLLGSDRGIDGVETLKEGGGCGLDHGKDCGADSRAEANVLAEKSTEEESVEKVPEMADADRDIGEVEEVEVDREVNELSSSVVNILHVEGKEIGIGGEAGNRGEKGVSLLPGEDEWEGIERSELEKRFGLAMKYLTSSTGVEALARLGSDEQMDLYGLHKVATEGPCYESQPLPLKVAAWTRWNAWQKLGSMTPDAAMEQYIILLSKCIPGWMEENAGEHAKLDRSKHSPEQVILCREPDVLNSSLQAQSSNVKQRNLDIQASIEADNATGVSKVFEQGLTSTFLLNLLFPTRGALLSLSW